MTEGQMDVLESKKQEETEVLTCDSCGGNTVFDPASGSMKCPFCGTENLIEATNHNDVELDFNEGLEQEDISWNKEKRVFRCDSCGAETVLDRDADADFCSFCGSSHIAKSENRPGIKPSLVVPFKVPQEEAVAKFKTWIGKRYFAPSKLKNSYELDRLSGAYIPYWTFDSQTDSAYTVRIGTYYYVTETRTVYEDGKPKQVTEQVRKIRWRTQHGNYSEFFDDVLVKASRNVATGLINKVEPFQLAHLVDYKTEYVSGFLAERYSIPLKVGWQDARSIIDSRIRNGILSKERGDEVQIVSVSTSYRRITYKHVLLPLWISSFRFNQKVYRFLVNGQTGKVSGQAPVSFWKVSFAVLAALAVLSVVLYFFDAF
ncbi:hypothetical protein [Sporosarcina cyprini]|uniref:hypothetical protein n=1 Tax=Sporosarcina cyprini TaxID=2910523 RepID=UPI001EDFC455|nr:hypothetical protein [Sporosarcina cyprini]MCG3089000.1 hypothetical protein [Sporosarcina cyprini]